MLGRYFHRKMVGDDATIQLRRQYEDYLKLSESWLFRSSALFGFVLSLRAQQVERKFVELNLALIRKKPNDELELIGSQFTFDDNDEIYRAIAENWKRSSIIMNHMRLLFGYEYFHFLQPNQYTEGSKVFTAKERELALDLASYRPKLVRAIYPLLQKKSVFFKSSDFYYFDLTNIYSGTRETVYKDVCCHVNDYGNELLARLWR